MFSTHGFMFARAHTAATCATPVQRYRCIHALGAHRHPIGRRRQLHVVAHPFLMQGGIRSLRVTHRLMPMM
jgi:hypothetical protein